MKRFSVPLKVFIIVVGIVGVIYGMDLTNDPPFYETFLMFTTQSNIAVVVYYICHLMATCRTRRTANAAAEGQQTIGSQGAQLPAQSIDAIPPRMVKWKFLVTMSIVLTGLVANILLQDTYRSLRPDRHPVWWIQHDIIPLATYLDWLLFSEKGLTRKWMPLFAAIFPLVYLAAILIIVERLHLATSPYPFLDIDTLGWGTVNLMVVGISAAFIAFGYICYGIDHLHGRRKS